MAKQRCFHCNKKLGLIDYTCKCDHKFCLKCKLPEIHNCNYDYKDNSNLSKKLVKVVNNKINKI